MTAKYLLVIDRMESVISTIGMYGTLNGRGLGIKVVVIHREVSFSLSRFKNRLNWAVK